MSISSHRGRWFRPMDFAVATAILISGACRQAPSPAPQPQVRRFAGVDIVPTHHSGFVVRIQSAVVGDGEPLYVIDGVRMSIPPNQGIDWFKPDDIVEIKVLKLPYELVEYGPSGVNGVIVITTKLALRRTQRR